MGTLEIVRLSCFPSTLSSSNNTAHTTTKKTTAAVHGSNKEQGDDDGVNLVVVKRSRLVWGGLATAGGELTGRGRSVQKLTMRAFP